MTETQGHKVAQGFNVAQGHNAAHGMTGAHSMTGASPVTTILLPAASRRVPRVVHSSDRACPCHDLPCTCHSLSYIRHELPYTHHAPHKKIRLIAGALALLLLVSMLALMVQFTTDTVVSGGRMDEFVRRSGSQLLLGGRQFRFAGANIYWMGLDENVDGIDYPTHFRVNDVLTTAEAMGATVIRSHTLGISIGCGQCVEPTLDVFNTAAFERIDYAILAANTHHLRLILPLVDNWSYYHGGRGTFTEWSGLSDANQFYWNETVISNFEHYIYQVLNHVNIYTHRAYKDEPTIMAWETGNELRAPTSWVQRIASYLKSIDTNHLVMDGNDMNSGADPNVKGDLALNTVDMYTGHYYPISIGGLKWDAYQAQRANKVFVVGEYDWTNQHGGDALAEFLREVERNTAISGDLFWSLFGRDDMGRYEQHKDGYTLHYPGDDAEMRAQVSMLVRHAEKMRV